MQFAPFWFLRWQVQLSVERANHLKLQKTLALEKTQHEAAKEKLVALLAHCKLGDRLPAALAWCDEKGVDDVVDIVEVGAEAAFAEALQLKEIKQKLLLKRLEELASSSASA